MTEAAALPNDQLWPRASEWVGAPLPADAIATARADLGLLGVPAFRTSITPTGANATPAAVRDALAHYSTWSATHGVDVSLLRVVDFGDVSEPDGPEGESRTGATASRAAAQCTLLLALGGDNSITFPLVSGIFSNRPEGLAECGLLRIDAHHDLRDGTSNGSPVRRLIEAGLPGPHVVQIGIADFSNSPAYAARAREWGITVVSRAELRRADIRAVASKALDIAGPQGRPVFVDIDVDVCDRAEVPACPSATPGGISADQLRQIAFECGRDERVVAIGITEIDATIDAPDNRTVRLAALLLLEAAAGLCVRSASA